MMNKLKTPLGKPQETFLAFEETLRSFAWPIETTGKTIENSPSDHTNRSSTPIGSSSTSSIDVNSSTDKGEWWNDLHRCGLLLQLLEALEKCMYNAYEGAALSLPPLPKVTMKKKYCCVCF